MFVLIPVVENINLPLLASSEIPAIEAKRSGCIQLSPDSPKLILLHICLDFSRKSLTPQLSTVYPIQCNSFLSHLKLGALIFGHRLNKVRLNSSIQSYLMALSCIFSDSKYSLHPLPHEKITFTCYSIFYP